MFTKTLNKLFLNLDGQMIKKRNDREPRSKRKRDRYGRKPTFYLLKIIR